MRLVVGQRVREEKGKEKGKEWGSGIGWDVV